MALSNEIFITGKDDKIQYLEDYSALKDFINIK